MFVSIEKAMQLTGRSKNALYRLMAKGYIHFVLCSKGKRHLELGDLRWACGGLKGEVAGSALPGENSPVGANHELLELIGSLRTEVAELGKKMDKQGQLLDALSGAGPGVPLPLPEAAAPVSATPEQDPEWPPFITCYADLAKRDEIKAKYHRS